MSDETDLDPAAVARLRRLGGPKLLREMLRLFREQAVAAIPAARAAHAAGDLAAVEQAVHSLKSSAGNVGARRLQELSDAIERRAEAADGPAAGPLLGELQRAFERLDPVLARLLDELNERPGP
jgi:HPt (histidine-containing phosphotransfer) domain-containing protein